jgi:hypothetical protein
LQGLRREVSGDVRECLREIGDLEKRLGHYRAHRMRLNNHSLFPNGVLGFRLALPRGRQHPVLEKPQHRLGLRR